ncbi:MAG: 3-hydroxyisobutyrate dehydrogenase [Arenicella sp.]|jgi:3-hydroxyisobutyrate dehydrogenase
MKIGFVGLGNVGGKLSGSLLRNGHALIVRDLDPKLVQSFVESGATAANSAKEVAELADVIITCLPSPAACSAVMEADDGVIAGLSAGKIWLEMSTTDQAEVKRIGELVTAKGAFALDSPVSGGCHRADTGNISIFAGGDRKAFDIALPLLTTMGRRVIHTGELGSASVLKVITNYLATAHLVALSEAWVVSNKMGIDPNVAYEAIKASSGNSFVHETESQVILNGSRDISFTMDLVLKDISLFDSLAQQHDIPLEMSPLLIDIFKDGQEKYGPREWSSNIIRRLEDALGEKVLGVGFPALLVDDEPEERGAEIVIPGRSDY